MEDIKRNKKEILEQKSTVPETNSLDIFQSRFEQTEERISEL